MINLGPDHPGLLLRVQHRASLIHTEVTRMTAIHLEYVDRYPNLNYLSKVLHSVAWVSFGASLASSYGDLREAISKYWNEVKLDIDQGAPALLSKTAQELIISIPGMPEGVQAALGTSVPYFDPCPLGMYPAGGGCP